MFIWMLLSLILCNILVLGNDLLSFDRYVYSKNVFPVPNSQAVQFLLIILQTKIVEVYMYLFLELYLYFKIVISVRRCTNSTCAQICFPYIFRSCPKDFCCHCMSYVRVERFWPGNLEESRIPYVFHTVFQYF